MDRGPRSTSIQVGGCAVSLRQFKVDFAAAFTWRGLHSNRPVRISEKRPLSFTVQLIVDRLLLRQHSGLNRAIETKFKTLFTIE